MLVSKLRLVHQCDRASWAKHSPAVASVLRPLARTSLPIQQPCRPSTAVGRAVNLLPRLSSKVDLLSELIAKGLHIGSIRCAQGGQQEVVCVPQL